MGAIRRIRSGCRIVRRTRRAYGCESCDNPLMLRSGASRLGRNRGRLGEWLPRTNAAAFALRAAPGVASRHELARHASPERVNETISHKVCLYMTLRTPTSPSVHRTAATVPGAVRQALEIGLPPDRRRSGHPPPPPAGDDLPLRRDPRRPGAGDALLPRRARRLPSLDDRAPALLGIRPLPADRLRLEAGRLRGRVVAETGLSPRVRRRRDRSAGSHRSRTSCVAPTRG